MEKILRNVTGVVSTLSRKVFHYETQKVYKRTIDKCRYKLFNISDLYKTQEKFISDERKIQHMYGRLI